MLSTTLVSIAAVSLFSLNGLNSLPAEDLIATRSISLENRHPNKFSNEVYKKNILLSLAYMDNGQTFTLRPGEAFAFHEDVFPEYEGKIVKTTNAHFNAGEGFKSDGYLVGNGVCHLASLINWVATDAGLKTYVPAKHNFASIPEISREYGVSIYSYPGRKAANAQRNLYITNSRQKPVTFRFNYQNGILGLSIFEVKE